jgi:uncharacterized protein (DUF2252 family)
MSRPQPVRGKEGRRAVPRSIHASLDLPDDRDPVARLEEQTPDRVPELVPIRYGRMLSSPFAFFRGAAHVMAHDLATAPRTGLIVQLCGDAHLSNFGGFASPERDFVFDLNDFDETLPGPFEWDVKRLVASFEIAGRDRGFSEAERSEAVLTAARTYRESMRRFASMGNLAVWYAHLDAAEIASRLRAMREKTGAKLVEQAVAKAQTKDSVRALAKFTERQDGEPRIVSDPPLIVPISELRDDAFDQDKLELVLERLVRSYRGLSRERRTLLNRYRYVDLARKVVGVGSVGTRCWIVLLMGADAGDPLFLQVKEAQSSVLEELLGRSAFSNHGRRVVEGQRLMQAASDIFLGWTRVSDPTDGIERDFYVRQLWDWKASVDVDTIEPRGLALYAQACGGTLARAHARSGDRAAIAAYLGKGDAFDRALAEFVRAYAEVNARDYEGLTRAVREGRITAVEGL